MSEHAIRNVLLLSGDDAFAERVTTALLSRFQVIRGNAQTDNLDVLLSSATPDVCLIDIDGASWDQPPNLSAIEDVKTRSPHMPVVIATVDVSASMLVAAMRLGANDVCEKDFASDELIAQVDQHTSRRIKPVGDEIAPLVTFLGAREGIGTTTTALALSETIAARAGPSSWVLLLDFSHPPAEIPDLVGARPSYYMTDAVHDLSRLDVTMIDSAFIRAWPGNLFVLPLASTDRGINSLALDDLTKLISVLRSYFHSVVADVNWCWRNQLAMRLFQASTHPVLCTSQSVTSIHATASFLQQVREGDGRDSHCRLVVTRHDAAIKPNLVEIQNALGFQTAPIAIHEDRKLVEIARNAGEALTRSASRSGFVRSISRLADSLDTEPVVQTNRNGRLLSRLHRKLGRSRATGRMASQA